MSITAISPKTRKFYANGDDLNLPFKFPSNYRRTTKYTLLTFIPFSLFIQFRRVANVYFLITAVLQSISYVSPLNPFSAVAPLVFVLSVSMLREGIEDYLRHRSDLEENSARVKIYIQGKFKEMKSQDIQVGNIVMVSKDEFFPCDLIMLSNSSPGNTAYIETASIDGEKNLKIRNSVNETHNLVKHDEVIRFMSEVQCDLPNNSIYTFAGSINLNGEFVPINKNNILLGGAVLRNTTWAVGIAVYTGPDTKLRMNMMKRKEKQSRVEKVVNKYILYILLLQFCMCLVPSVLYAYYLEDSIQDKEFRKYDSSILSGFLNYFTYFLLLNTMLPISLIISLELLKIGQGFLMQKDLNLYSGLRNRPCKVSSFSLNEELGMIEHIFTDKTGTLTCNLMVFKACAIGDKVYGDNSSTMINSTLVSMTNQNSNDRNSNIIHFNGKELQEDLWSERSFIFPYPIGSFKLQKEVIKHFLLCMALCHECLVETNQTESKFIGQSPDEIALIEAACRLGIKFSSRYLNLVTIEVKNGDKTVQERFEVCCNFEFDSDRKRNSVVVKELRTGNYLVYAKGADNVMVKLLNENCAQYSVKIKKELKWFSEKGLRTLVLAYRQLDFEEFTLIKNNFDQAANLVVGREEAIGKVAGLVECKLWALACSAVEDSLQDEVPETIQDFIKAGIKVWMLTGDKLETAENIGRTCSLITENMDVIRIDAQDFMGVHLGLQESIDLIMLMESDICLIIQGDSLQHIMSPAEAYKQMSNEIVDNFWKLTLKCKSVVCCRMTPGQKRDVVHLVKRIQGAVVLTVGDGANDVPMILEGNIGIGIYGEEGMQAVQASDYSLGEFKYLWELLFVHGRFNYIRQSEMILYFIYKNLVFTLPQFWFCFYCAFSGQTVYDDWYITMYNMILTALPLMIKGLLEKDIRIPSRVDFESNETEINCRIRYEVPKLYSVGKLNTIFTGWNFTYWVFIGIFHSALVFFIPLYVSNKEVISSEGMQVDYVFFSITSFTCIILLVNLKLALWTKYWTIYHVVGIVLFSFLLYVAMIFLYDLLSEGNFSSSIYDILFSPQFYFTILVVICAFFVTDGGFFIKRQIMHPSDSRKLNERYAQNAIYIESHLTT